MIPVPSLETKRLILKPMSLDYIDDYNRYFIDYEIIRYMNDRVPWPYPDEDCRAWVSDRLKMMGTDLWQWGIFQKSDPDHMIGSIDVRTGDVDNRGFWLAKSFWGRGYMSEAAEAATACAFEKLGFTELLMTNAKGNERSRRIKERSGAKLVKVVPQKFVDPALTESERWILTKADWLKNKKR